ncbi:putative toxin-antitoxin system toxin component, PIN family [Thermodesulfobacteriota bacterium]
MGSRKINRVVIDTNVLVSGMLFNGVPGRLISLWKKKHIIPLCSKDIIDEYLRVLAYPKFKLTDNEIEYLLTAEILPWFEPINVPEGKPFIREDPPDDIFIWCAVKGKANYIISGDNHLLKMKNSPVPVLSVSDFLMQFE